MTLIKRNPNRKPVIDLNGPEGNAFALLGYANRVCKQTGMNAEPILADMRSGNYRHLVEVFEKHFGSLFDIVLPDNWSDYEKGTP